MRYTAYGPRARGYKTILIIVSFIILTMVVIGVSHRSYIPKQQKVTVKSISVPNKKTGYQTVQGKYLFSGTVMLGRAVDTYAKGNYEQPFSGMDTLGQYDDNIGVLECPITSNNVSYQTQVDDLIFNCSPNWLPTLKEHFPILNLSSNHLNDMGSAGYQETVQRLTSSGFQTVGNYNPHAEKDDCRTIVLPVRSQKPKGQEEGGFLPVAFCSFNYKSLFKPEPGELESIQQWSRLMPVIGLMNGGPEYQHQAGADQMNVAHQMIDYGADFVVGNGTHWVQNTEVYKGKLIVYSMGNFIFDQLDYDGRIALNLSVGMNLTYDDNVGKWLKLGDSCKSSTSNCLKTAEAQGLKKIQPSFNFDAVGSYGGYQQVSTRANQQQQKDIEQRANWTNTQHLLGE